MKRLSVFIAASLLSTTTLFAAAQGTYTPEMLKAMAARSSPKQNTGIFAVFPVNFDRSYSGANLTAAKHRIVDAYEKNPAIDLKTVEKAFLRLLENTLDPDGVVTVFNEWNKFLKKNPMPETVINSNVVQEKLRQLFNIARNIDNLMKVLNVYEQFESLCLYDKPLTGQGIDKNDLIRRLEELHASATTLEELEKIYMKRQQTKQDYSFMATHLERLKQMPVKNAQRINELEEEVEDYKKFQAGRR